MRQRSLFLKKPWPDSTAPNASVQRRAIFCAKKAMAGMPLKSFKRITAVYLASGWSNQAYFAVHANGDSVFAKATRNLKQANLDNLNDEYQAAKWAYQAALGPAPDAIALLRRFHYAFVGDWQAPLFSPISFAQEQLKQKLALKILLSKDAEIIERVTQRASAALTQAPAFVPVPYNTNVHVKHIFLNEQKRLHVVDCEDAGLGDLMRELGTLTANLATMGSIDKLTPLALSDRYGATDTEKTRLHSHYELSLALYAGWTAAHGSRWQGQHQAAMHQLRNLG